MNLTTPGDITNHGRIDGSLVTTHSQNFINDAVVFGDILTINADTIINTGAAAIIATTEQANLYARTALENKDGATIYSLGNIVIAGSENLDRTGTVLNESATIEADGNIGIFANQITNKKREFATEQREISRTSKVVNITPPSGYHTARREYTEIITETVITKDSPSGQILAGQDIVLEGNIENNASTIAAGGDLEYDSTKLRNIAYESTRTVTRTGKNYYTRTEKYCDHKVGGHCYDWDHRDVTDVTPYYQQTSQKSSIAPAVISANQRLTGQGVTIENITVVPEGAPVGSIASTLPDEQISDSGPSTETPGFDFTVPASGLYTVNPDPGSKYLVETDPRFTNYQQFISSDYMLEKLNLEPEKTLTRLGDGFYEQKLVRDQITQLTGRRYLEDYSSSEEQYKALLENGATFAQQFNLQVGIALTAEQMAQLTSDIVWLEEREINGQKVLVPVVYLASTRDNITPSGAVITADYLDLRASGDVTNTGTIRATIYTNISGDNIINRGGVIDSGLLTQLTAAQDILNQSGTIRGGHVNLTAGRDIKNETLVSEVYIQEDTTAPAKHNLFANMQGQSKSISSSNSEYTTTMINTPASIEAQGSLTMQAGRDISITGAQVSAGQDITVNAGRNLEVGSVEHRETYNVNDRKFKAGYEATTNIVSTIQAGNNVNLAAQNDATLRGTQVSAGNDLSLAAGGNITVTAVKDRVMDDRLMLGYDGNYRHIKTDDETVIGSSLGASGDVNISAIQSAATPNDETNRGNVTLEGSDMFSQTGKITVIADNDVTIKEIGERHETFEETRTKDSSLLSSTTTVTRDHTVANYAIGSALSGDQVQISSGNDLTLQGSQVVATHDIALSAANDVNITTAQETYDAENYYYQKTSGISASFDGGVSVFAGTTKQESTTTEHTVNQVGSIVGSTNGTVTINAGKDTTITGSDIIGQEGIDVTAQNITIEAATNTSDIHQIYEFKQTGLTISVGNTFTDKAGEASSAYDRSQQVSNDRLEALYDLKAYRAADKAIDEVKDKRALTDLTMTVGFGSTKQESETTTHITSSVGSSLSSGGNITLNATGSGTNATDGDLNILGSSVSGENVTLAAANDINLKSSADTLDSHTESSGKSIGIGVTAGISKGNAGTSPYIEGSKSSGVIDETSTTYNETTITANNTLTIKSSRDTNFVGGKASGETVIVDVGRDLNIISQQDTQTYHEANKSASAKVGIGGGSTASANKSNIDSTYQSVNEQSGIFAGTGGFDIEVEGNTDLKGAVIASETDKNRLSTGSLTYSDLENTAEYEADSKGISVDTHKYKNTDENYKNKGVTPDIGTSATGEDSSTTHAAIAAGTIEVRNNPNMDISNLSRDTQNAVNALDQIFDKKTVQEQQELSKMFGEEAFKLVGDIAAKKGWDEGSPEKIAMHAFVGAVMADIGGGDALSGAAGAGVNEAVQKELADHFKDDPDLHQWASYIVGSAAAEVVGGDAQTGGSTAASGTKNNFDSVHKRTLAYGCALVVASGYIAIQDATGKVIATWSAEANGFVDEFNKYLGNKVDDVVNYFNPPHTDTRASDELIIKLEDTFNNPVLGNTGTTFEGELQVPGSTSTSQTPQGQTSLEDPFDPGNFVLQARDSSKNEQHGDGGRALSKAEKQIEALEKQLEQAVGNEKKKIQQKIQNIRKTAQSKKTGENHSQKAKR